MFFPLSRIIALLMAAVLCFALLVPLALARHNTGARDLRRDRLPRVSRRKHRAYGNACAGAAEARRSRLQGIYVILNEETRVWNSRARLDGGVRIVQYRAKTGIVAETLRRLREITRERDALLIVNDDWRAARRIRLRRRPSRSRRRRLCRRRAVRAAMRGMPHRPVLRHAGGGAARQRERRRLHRRRIGLSRRDRRADAGEPIGIDGLRRLARATPLCRSPRSAASIVAGSRRCAPTGVAMAAVISAVANCSAAGTRRARARRGWDGA